MNLDSLIFALLFAAGFIAISKIAGHFIQGAEYEIESDDGPSAADYYSYDYTNPYAKCNYQIPGEDDL